VAPSSGPPGSAPDRRRAIRPRSRTALLAAACLAVSAAAGATSASGGTLSSLEVPGHQLADGDFETGNLTQWSVAARARPSSITVVRKPVRQGRFAARFEVRRGDNPIGFGDRAQIQINTGEREGQTRWYSWSTQFAKNFPRYANWQLVAQWHARADGSPPIGFFVDDDDLVLQVHRTGRPGQVLGVVDIWRGPLLRGRWRDIKMHVHWSGSDRLGWVELWIDGARQRFDDGSLRRRIRTMFPGIGNYFAIGYYRQSGLARTGVVYHDAFRMSG
jgi:hypothetical protein